MASIFVYNLLIPDLLEHQLIDYLDQQYQIFIEIRTKIYHSKNAALANKPSYSAQKVGLEKYQLHPMLMDRKYYIYLASLYGIHMCLFHLL